MRQSTLSHRAVALLLLLFLGVSGSVHAQPQNSGIQRAVQEAGSNSINRQHIDTLPAGVAGQIQDSANAAAAELDSLFSSSSASGTHGLQDSSGQLLFQSIPNFPETELQALATFSDILRTPPLPQQQDLTGAPSLTDASGSDNVILAARSAADDFIEALLKTTRASLASSNPGLLWKPADSQQERPDADSNSEQASADKQPISSTAASSAAAAAAAYMDAAPPAASTPAAASTEQQLADTSRAVDGQVLVTQAELIPSMQQFDKIVLASYKMVPMRAQELLAQAAGPQLLGSPATTAARATAWQDALRQALEAAAALETNTTETHIHTKMTSILNLVSLELWEQQVPALMLLALVVWWSTVLHVFLTASPLLPCCRRHLSLPNLHMPTRQQLQALLPIASRH